MNFPLHCGAYEINRNLTISRFRKCVTRTANLSYNSSASIYSFKLKKFFKLYSHCIMGLCNIECVERIARYLDVPPGRLEMSNKNIVLVPECKTGAQPIQGFSTIVQALVRSSKYPDKLGSEKEVQALTQQWLEFAAVYVNHADLSVNAKRILNELNTVLRDQTYITGTEKTIADVTLYYSLHPIMKELNLQEKAQYVHISRWFNDIQQEEKLRQELDIISFNLLHAFM